MTTDSSETKIQTVAVSPGMRVSFCPDRGGIITSLRLQGVEVLFFDEETFADQKRSVRGGIPILFPNAGAFADPAFPALKRHGFAREKASWTAQKNTENTAGFIETLVSDEETLSSYPYEFKLSIAGTFEENGSFILIQKAENLEPEKIMPLSMGLHPYFRVANEQKGSIRFNFEGGKYIEDNIGLWGNGAFVSVDNPKIQDPSAVMEIIMPGLGTLSMDASVEYKKVWVWSEAGKDFICIEPVMRDPGGLVDDPYEVKPKEIFSATVALSLRV